LESYEKYNNEKVSADGIKHRKLKFWRLNNSVVTEI